MLNEGQVIAQVTPVTSAAPEITSIASSTPMTLPVTPTPMPQIGFIESVKNALTPEAIANKLGIDKNVLIDISIFGAIGFILGFLLKKYSEYFIACVFFIIGMGILQHFDYLSVSINVQKIHEMLGLQALPMSMGYGALLLEWIKSNIPATVSCVVGFLIGLKVA